MVVLQSGGLDAIHVAGDVSAGRGTASGLCAGASSHTALLRTFFWHSKWKISGLCLLWQGLCTAALSALMATCYLVVTVGGYAAQDLLDPTARATLHHRGRVRDDEPH